MNTLKCPWCQGAGTFGDWPSESAKYVHLVQHLMTPDKNVIEVGSGGWPVVPNALQVELTLDKFETYTSHQLRPPVQFRVSGINLPFQDKVSDVLYSSHLIEDFTFQEQRAVLKEWARVVKSGGLLIIIHPDRDIFGHCVRHLGQIPNCAHKGEHLAGELGNEGKAIGLRVIKDENTSLSEFDYGLITIFEVTS